MQARPSMSEEGRALLKRFEGLRLDAYPDGGGYSIGYGHHGSKAGASVTRAEAEELFVDDLERFENAVAARIPTSTATSQSQFDALVSLAYNIGPKAFAESTLARYHSAGDYRAAAAEFSKWKNSDGHVSPALVARRKLEAELYLQGLSELPPPETEPAPAGPGITFPGVVIPARVAALPIALAGALVFFCPACGATSRSGHVMFEPERDEPPVAEGLTDGRSA